MGSLGINAWNLIVQLIAFIIFVWLLWRYALGPIVRVLDQRQERIRESMEAAQKMQAELQATAAKNEEVLVEARREAQRIVSQARQQLRQEIGDLAVTAAGKIVRKELDPRTQARLIEETLTEAGVGAPSANGRDTVAEA